MINIQVCPLIFFLYRSMLLQIKTFSSPASKAIEIYRIYSRAE